MTREKTQGGAANEILVETIRRYLGNGGEKTIRSEDLYTNLAEIAETDLFKDTSDMAWSSSPTGMRGVDRSRQGGQVRTSKA